eukprot:m.122705 g.122705  ORF g.122705 m.122705 type:complete len:465 (-) comp15657_c0_seq3:24-1418(-)
MDNGLPTEPLLSVPEDSTVSHRSHRVAVDKLLYCLFFLEGIGSLFPWNAFITVTSFFDERFKDSSYKGTYENYFSFSFQISNILFLLLAMRFQQRFSLYSRVMIPLVIQLLVFSAMTVLTKVQVPTNSFFIVVMVLTLISGGATAFLQGGLFGLAGVMPEQYISALMGGQGLGGLIVSLLNVLTLGVSSGGDNAKQAAFIFFTLSVAVLFACLAGFVYLQRNDFVRSRLKMAATSREESRRASRQASPAKHVQGRGKRTLTRKRSFLLSEDDDWTLPLKKAIRPALLVFTVFATTLAIFPAIGASVVSTSNDKNWSKFFVPVTCFVMFNLGDLIGRMLTSVKAWPSVQKHHWLTWPVMARWAFLPLFLFCNIDLNGAEAGTGTVLTPFFTNDAWPTVFMLLLGVTNGYFGTMCMMLAPGLVTHGEAEAVGSFTVLFLTLGLLSGSLIGFGLKAVLCSCNPFNSG